MMMETVFVIFLAGCSHDMSLCEPVDRWEVRVPDKAACEVILDERLMNNPAEWPVYQGSCESGEMAAAPDWWPSDTIIAGLDD
jgi:hypothetical protein